MNIAGMEEDEEEEEEEPTTLRRSPAGLPRTQGGKRRTFVFNPANGRIMQVRATAAPSKEEGGKEWQWFWEELPMKEEEYEATPTFAYCRTEAPTAEQRGDVYREGAGGGCWHHLFFRGSDGLLHELYSKSDDNKRNESKHQTWQHKVYTDLPPIRSGTSTLSCVPRSQQQDCSLPELFVFYLSDTNGHLLLLHKQLQQGERWTYTCVNVSQRCGMKEMQEEIEGVAVKAQLYKGQIEAYFVELGSQSRLFRFAPLLSPLTKEQQGVTEMDEVKEEEKEQERDKKEFWHETMRWEVTDVFATFVRRKVRKSNRPASHRVRLRWRRRKRASRLLPPSASSYYSNMITITAPIEKEEKEVYEECAEITQVASVGCFVHDNITHVFYVGRDGHIFELYSRDGRRWRQLNLTEEASRSSSSKMMMEDDDSGDEEEEQVPKASALYPLCCAPDPHSGDTYITFVSDEEDYFTLHQLSWTKQTKRWVDAQIIDTCWQPFVSTPAINGSGFELQLPTSSFSPTSSGSFIKVRKKKNDGDEEGGEEREEEERKLPTVSTIGPSCFLFDEETAEISLPNVQWSTIGGKKEAEHQQEEGDDASFNEEDDDDDEGERFCSASSSSASVMSSSLRMTVLMGFFEGPQQNLWVHSRPLQNPFAPSTISQVASFLAPGQEQLQQQESKAEEEKENHDVDGYEEKKEPSVTFSSLSPASSCSSSSSSSSQFSSTSAAKRTDAGFLRRSYKQKKLMELIRFFNSGDLYWVEPKVTTKPTVGITSSKSSSSSSDEDDDEKHKSDSSTSFSSAPSIPKEEKKDGRQSDKLGLNRIELHPAYFDLQTQSWRSLSSPAPSFSSSSPSSWWQNEEEITRRQRQPQLKLLTYNILFHRTAGKVRHPELLKIVQKEEVDIIAFQEVTKPFLQLVLEQTWVREGYAVSDGGGGETVEPYGVLMLSRIPFHRLCLHDLPTKLARKALIAEFLLSKDNNSSSTYKLSVATAHFESYPEDEPIRKQQLELVFSLLRSDKKTSTSVLMGDFNFGDGKENENIPSEYVDLWPQLHPEEEGYTFNYRKNKLTSALRSYQVRRTDRILLSNHASSQQQRQPPKWIASNIRMIGTEEIKPASNADDNNNTKKEKEKEEEEEKEETEEEQQQEKERDDELLSSSSCASSSSSLPMVRGRVVPFWPSDHFGVVAVLHACSSAE